MTRDQRSKREKGKNLLSDGDVDDGRMRASCWVLREVFILYSIQLGGGNLGGGTMMTFKIS